MPCDAFQLHADAGEVLFASSPAGTSIASHRHGSDNVGVITQGELRLTTDGSVFGVGAWYHVPAVEHAADLEVDTAEIEFWFRVG